MKSFHSTTKPNSIILSNRFVLVSVMVASKLKTGALLTEVGTHPGWRSSQDRSENDHLHFPLHFQKREFWLPVWSIHFGLMTVLLCVISASSWYMRYTKVQEHPLLVHTHFSATFQHARIQFWTLSDCESLSMIT